MGFNPLKAVEHAVGSAAHAIGDVAEEGGKAFESAMKDAEQAAKHMSLSDLGHTALDVASFVPGLGTVTGLVNAGWYAAEGDWGNAALSAATAIPIAGDFVDAAKVGKDAITIGKDVETAVKLGEDAAKATEDGAKIAKDAKDIKEGKDVAQAVDKSAATAAKASGPVAYGSTDLGKTAIEFRKAHDITSARNVSVFEYTENGVKKTLAMASERGAGHAERLIAKKLEEAGIDPKNVTRIYSELEPCVAPGGYCKPFIDRTFPNASVSWSFEYGATQASRAAGVDALKKALQSIF
jgi:hypothetical protein